jgi:hypothetical protein
LRKDEGRSNSLVKNLGSADQLRLILPREGPCLGLQILLPYKSGVETPKAKRVNPERKSWSPRLGVEAMGQLLTQHKNIPMLKYLNI